VHVNRARSLPVLTAVAALLLAGCGRAPAEPTDVTSDVDRERAAYLTSEPLIQAAVEPPLVKPGIVHSNELGWVRTEVQAVLYESSGGTGPSPATVEDEVGKATNVLRTGGWTVHWEMCLPPPQMVGMDASAPPTEAPIPVGVNRADGYEWIAAAYKIDEGVSYFALVIGVLVDGGDAVVEALMRAPNARDPANLFTSAPAALDKDKTCAEDGKVPTAVEQAGTPTIIRDWDPFPNQTQSRDPLQR